MFWYNKGFYEYKIHESAIELSQEEYDAIMENVGDGGLLQEDSNGRPVVVQTDTILQNRINNLRLKREAECFSVINQNFIVDGKSLSWFDTLNEQQKTEASEWVQKWRDVTETKIIPERPLWLD